MVPFSFYPFHLGRYRKTVEPALKNVASHDDHKVMLQVVLGMLRNDMCNYGFMSGIELFEGQPYDPYSIAVFNRAFGLSGHGISRNRRRARSSVELLSRAQFKAHHPWACFRIRILEISSSALFGCSSWLYHAARSA